MHQSYFLEALTHMKSCKKLHFHDKFSEFSEKSNITVTENNGIPSRFLKTNANKRMLVAEIYKRTCITIRYFLRKANSMLATFITT